MNMPMWLQRALRTFFPGWMVMDAADFGNALREQFDYGAMFGRTQAKTHMRYLPQPLTPEQMAGAEYGMYVTPAGFACDTFGESSIPAPGEHGYEQRAYYVSREDLDSASIDLRCHGAAKFDKPGDSDALVPVIVTVLR